MTRRKNILESILPDRCTSGCNESCPRYVALSGESYVESSDSLEELIGIVQALVCPADGLDVVIWRADAVAAVVLSTGQTIILEGEQAWQRPA
jgi:hypothetical protein